MIKRKTDEKKIFIRKVYEEKTLFIDIFRMLMYIHKQNHNINHQMFKFKVKNYSSIKSQIENKNIHMKKFFVS